MKVQSSLSVHVSGSPPSGLVKGSVFSLLPCCRCCVLLCHMSTVLH